MLKIFLNNQWVEYNYTDLYNNYGYTNTPSVDKLVYDEGYHLLESWENNNLIWIQDDREWYSISQLPYYLQQDEELVLYDINVSSTNTLYLKLAEEYVRETNEFISVEELHDTKGITKTPSSVYLEESGVPIIWYNSVENLYWNDIEKAWYTSPLPDVSTDEDFGDSNWVFASNNGSSVGFPPGVFGDIYYNNGSEYVKSAYEGNKAYAVIEWRDIYDQFGGRTQFSIINNSDNVGIKNESENTIVFTKAKVAVCATDNVEIIVVYDSSNNAFNAFKYTTGGTDYYYVLDGTQIDWTDDLSSIGYSETPAVVLPTAYDIASGVISSIQLPTFNDGKYINTSFESLRYYAKGTVSNTYTTSFAYGINTTWFVGTITWYDPSLGDLSDKIRWRNPQNIGLDKQDVIRIWVITENHINGYGVYDTLMDQSVYRQVASYSYTNGTHSMKIYMGDVTNNPFDGALAGRIMIRYLDGTTTFNNLDAFDLINVSSGTLSKETTTDRYDMYSVWGGNITMKAGSTAYTGYTRQDKQSASVSGNEWTKLFDENGNYIDYDSTKNYVITSYYTSTSSYGNNGYFVIGQSDGKLSVKYYRTGFSASATWFTYTVS